MCVSHLWFRKDTNIPNRVALTKRPDTHCPGIRAGPVDAVGPGCWTVNSGYRLAAMEASWTAERSERSCSVAAAFCVARGSSETKPGKYYRWCEHAAGRGNIRHNKHCGNQARGLTVVLLTRPHLFICLFVPARQIISVWCGRILPTSLTLPAPGHKLQI